MQVPPIWGKVESEDGENGESTFALSISHFGALGTSPSPSFFPIFKQKVGSLQLKGLQKVLRDKDRRDKIHKESTEGLPGPNGSRVRV